MNARILIGDVRERLREIGNGSVQCCVTSPPYWGLRDYGTAKWEGGDPTCGHVERAAVDVAKSNRLGVIPGYRDHLPAENAAFKSKESQFRETCGKCGGRRIDSQIGLEQTPEEYVAQMVAVFREVRRVLRDDGTLWLNLGDSYATGAGAVGKCPGGGEQGERWNRMPIPGLKPKDLVGIPWMVAFALRADGWWLRSDCVWHKPNPMPESIEDRPTKAHEYLFLLAKSQRYFYDKDAVAESASAASAARYEYEFSGAPEGATIVPGDDKGQRTRPDGFQEFSGKRNRRTVWTIATQPFKGAHFAVMPEALVEPCVLAGTSEKGACAKCGAPWERDVIVEGESAYQKMKRLGHSKKRSSGLNTAQALDYAGAHTNNTRPRHTTGWSPSCSCEADPVPCTVLDPFTGSGTVAVVALKHGRRFVGCELNPKYAEIARNRINGDSPLFNRVEAA